MVNRKKSGRASDHITFESDNDELRDEIDQFHDERKKVAPGSYRRVKKAEPEEVLNVEGDSGEEQSSGNDSSDFDDEDDDDVGITSNQWGRKRRDYYSTDYVDKDWGGMREEEIEEAELEEQDALIRQKELDRVAAELVDDFDDEPMVIQSKEQIIKDTNLEWNYSNVKKLNKQTSKLVEEYAQRKDLMTVIVEPLRDIIQKLPEKAILRRQLLMVIDVYSKHLLNISFILKEKAESFIKQQFTNELLDVHPVMEEYSHSKRMIKKVDSFLDKNANKLNQLIEKVKNGADFSSLTLPEITKKKTILPVMPITDEQAEEVAQNDDDAVMTSDNKRKAMASIAKNSQSTKSRKKKDKHSKLANRRKYKEIQKKVRSQVGVVRRETEKYTGEARGIRASTIKSVKLIA